MTYEQKIIDDYVGKTESSIDKLDLRPIRFMQSIVPGTGELNIGDPLPPLWHWLYFHTVVSLENLGEDGHPRRGQGQFLPPVKLDQRMWAGGHMSYRGQFRIGDTIEKRSTITDIRYKEGKTGALCFVTLEHEYRREGELLLCESQDVVYKNNSGGSPRLQPAPQDADASESLVPDPVMLFRYSALTFNGHRIHYDADYCRDVEGYPNLVFHGPFTATLLADLVMRKQQRALTEFKFRGVAPVFCDEQLKLNYREDDGFYTLWSSGPHDNLTMQAEAKFK